MKLPRPTLTARDWRNVAIALALWFAILGLPVFFIPDRVLSNSPAAAQFTSVVANYVPMIDRTARSSQIPEVLRFYFACLWAASPVLFFAVLAWALLQVGRHPVPRYDPVTILVILAAGLGFVYIAATYPMEPSARTYRTLSSRFGLSFFGPFWVGLAAFFAAGVAAWVFGLLSGRIWRQSREPDAK
jgi:hypothetical protein